MKHTLLILFCLLSFASLAAEQTAPAEKATPLSDGAFQAGDIIAYYNHEWQPVGKDARAFYYRKLVSIDSNKGFWVQDFYADTHTKQTDPLFVLNKQDIAKGNIEPSEGSVFVWYKNGHKKEQSQYQNGQIQSLVQWHGNGQKQLEGYFQQGKRQGVWTGWYPNGNKRWQGSFTNGLQQGVWQYWYPTGELNVKGAFNEGKRQDLWLIWSKAGRKEREMQFEQGEKVAQWNSFDETSK